MTAQYRTIDDYDTDQWEEYNPSKTAVSKTTGGHRKLSDYNTDEWTEYNSYASPPEPTEEKDESWNITRGLKSGIYQTIAAPVALVSMAAKVGHADESARVLAGVAGRITAKAETYQPDTTFTELVDDPTLEGAVDWALYTIGNFAPSMAVGFGGAGIGAKLFVRTAIKRGVAKGLSKKAAAEAITKKALNKIALKGAATGLVTSTAGLETAPMYMEDVRRHGVEGAKILPHVVTGGLAGLVELGLAGFGSGHYRLIKKFFGEIGESAAKKSPNAAMRMLKEIGRQSGGEAFQELTQEELAIANEFWTSTDKEREVFEFFSREKILRGTESLAGGGIMGVLGGVGAGAISSKNIQDTAEDTLSDDETYSRNRDIFIEKTTQGLADGSVTIEDVKEAKRQHEAQEDPDLKISATLDSIIKTYEETGRVALKALEDFKADIGDVDTETALDFKNELIREYPHLEDQANEVIINAQLKPKEPEPIKFMVTAQDRTELKNWGYTDKQIDKMKPEEVQTLLAGPKPEKAIPEPAKPEKVVEAKAPEAVEGEKAESILTDAPFKKGAVKTGKPVKFRYLHNKERAPDFGSEFAQDIEPAGKYVASASVVAPSEAIKKVFDFGVADFKNPLVLEHKTPRHGGWKTDLSKMYDGKTGKELSKAIIADGFDGIVTVDKGRISESVILSDKPTPAPKKTDVAPEGVGVEKKPVKKPKVSTKGKNIITMRGAIKNIGGINFLNFKGELRDMPTSVKFLSRKAGVPIDDAVRQLREDGWLDKDATVATFLEDLRTDKDILGRDRLGKDISEKKEFEKTEAEKKFEKEMAREPETPPEGEYETIAVDNLKEGETYTIIEGQSKDGWDTYEVHKTKEGVTLEDGEILKLEPWDEVQVLKEDLAKEPKKLPTEKAKPKEPFKPDFKAMPLGDVTVKTKALREKTGETVVVEENAEQALERIDKEIEKYYEILACL